MSKQGCLDGSCKLRIDPLVGQHTNGGCKCLQGLPTKKRLEVEKKLHQQNKMIVELVEALQFYANPGTYHAVTVLADSPCGDFVNDFSDEHGDDLYERSMPGKLARHALTQFDIGWDIY